jgi:hypothetical protein
MRTYPPEVDAMNSICPHGVYIRLSDFSHELYDREVLVNAIASLVENSFVHINTDKNAEMYLFLYSHTKKRPIQLTHPFNKIFEEPLKKRKKNERIKSTTQSTKR